MDIRGEAASGAGRQALAGTKVTWQLARSASNPGDVAVSALVGNPGDMAGSALAGNAFVQFVVAVLRYQPEMGCHLAEGGYPRGAALVAGQTGRQHQVLYG